MAQFHVYRITGDRLVSDLQTDLTAVNSYIKERRP